MTPPIVLATTSRYKRMLFERLHLTFDCVDAQVDETPRADEPPAELALRLALEKARAGARSSAPGAIVIGADQVASSAAEPHIGKPGTIENNRRQLQRLSGQLVRFYTAVALVDDDSEQTALDVTEVEFRTLTDAEIDRYLRLEPAPDCAGGCKVEGLGISLLAAVRSEDPTGLIGLPLIELSAMLRARGLPGL